MQLHSNKIYIIVYIYIYIFYREQLPNSIHDKMNARKEKEVRSAGLPELPFLCISQWVPMHIVAAVQQQQQVGNLSQASGWQTSAGPISLV
jgi:hypothetical protein